MVLSLSWRKKQWSGFTERSEAGHVLLTLWNGWVNKISTKINIEYVCKILGIVTIKHAFRSYVHVEETGN